MKTRKTFREVGEWMDDRPLEKRGISPEYDLRSLAKQHRWLNFDESNISFRDIIERHKGGTDSKDVSFLFYNTYLLDGVAGFGGKPFRSLRADLIGKEIRNSKYDIAALCEVFEERYQKILKKQRFPFDAMGPVWTALNISSGLYTLSKFPLDYKRNRFEEKGPSLLSGLVPDAVADNIDIYGDLVDKKLTSDERKSNPDYHSNKGVLLTVIDLGVGKIDLYTTHLFWGSGNFNPIDKTDIQLKQLKELTEFIKETHNPKHVVIVAGDMNINPGKSHVNGRAYEKMRDLLSNISLNNGGKISLEDLWKIRGGIRGGTNTPTQGCAFDNRLINPTSGIIYCNDDSNETSVAKNEEGRYDYIFVQKPTASHDIIIDFSRMKRRPFPFPDLSFDDIKNLIEGPRFAPLFNNKSPEQKKSIMSEIIKKACNNHLSDHIGVDVKMLINKK